MRVVGVTKARHSNARDLMRIGGYLVVGIDSQWSYGDCIAARCFKPRCSPHLLYLTSPSFQANSKSCHIRRTTRYNHNVAFLWQPSRVVGPWIYDRLWLTHLQSGGLDSDLILPYKYTLHTGVFTFLFVRCLCSRTSGWAAMSTSSQREWDLSTKELFAHCQSETYRTPNTYSSLAPHRTTFGWLAQHFLLHMELPHSRPQNIDSCEFAYADPENTSSKSYVGHPLL